MNKGKISIGSILLGIFVISFTLYMCLTFEPIERKINNCFQVYLSGRKIGLIQSDEELYKMIDEEQKDIKELYNVSKVFSPSGLDVQPISTYKDEFMTVREMYEKIKGLEPFTIEGYEITIKNKTDASLNKKLYILDKKFLEQAIKNTVLAFVGEKEYDIYLSGEKVEIKEDGKEITDIYLENEVTIKKTYVSSEEKIITDLDTLSMYFLFGTDKIDSTYEVKESDTMETIAYNNKLGVEDLLIANPDLGGTNALLAVGQKINVAPVKPLSNIVVESFDTEFQTIKYETKTEFDKSLNADQSYVKQEGKNGLSKVVYATKEMNGVILATSLVSEETISETVDKIVVYGAKNVVYYGNTTYWAWPTSKPFRISSNYGYRNHPIRGEYHFHPALDITGVKKYDIYAIQDGTVTKAVQTGYNGGNGSYVTINHGNGYVASYLHLKKNSIVVKVGEKVQKGQIIGTMGCTGSCSGTHLDFRVKKDGEYINPMKMYK